MSPAPVRDSIAAALWLSDEATRSVVAALGGGGDPAMRFVGGCVRNTLLGLDVGDIDIATIHTPQRVMELAAVAGLKAVPTGLDHGTVTVIAEGKPFEVTTLRRDVKTDGRRAEVAYTADWAADAARRDFTMNAIYADARGSLYDPVGGTADLEERRVVFIGEARERIREDFLRILRFFRFHAWYGKGPLDVAGLAACIAERAGLAQLSAERVQKELLRLLEAREPVDVLQSMADRGILALVLPEAKNFTALARLCAVEACYLYVADAVRRLGVLIEADAIGTETLAARLRLSNTARERLVRLRTMVADIAPDIDGRALRMLLYREGVEAVVDRLVVSWAARGPDTDVDLWEALIEIVKSYKRPKLPISGNDVMALGLSGTEVGRVLDAVEAWWIEEDFAPTREASLAKARALLPDS